jgi:hypothetical protein
MKVKADVRCVGAWLSSALLPKDELLRQYPGTDLYHIDLGEVVRVAWSQYLVSI